jgi:hypothetical protein
MARKWSELREKMSPEALSELRAALNSLGHG